MSSPSSLVTAVYDPKAFIPHAASHGQAFAHCQRFSTAASRRSLGSVSVPVWLTTLSGQLPVKRLGRPSPYQLADGARGPPQAVATLRSRPPLPRRSGDHLGSSGISTAFAVLSQAWRVGSPRVAHPFAAIQHLLLSAGPRDLHALSTPPAFALSQDQTLRQSIQISDGK